MSSEDWPEVRLGDYVDLLTGFPFKSAEFTEDAPDVRLARGGNVVQGRFRWDGVRRWPRTDVDAYSNYLLEPGDVVLAMDRPWIEAGLKYAAVSPVDSPCLLVQRVCRLRGLNGLSTRFLRYIIGSPAFTEHILAVQTGTAVPHISGKQIIDFRFLLPPLTEQECIADILGSLDDKIELNRRMNRTLESIARAIFKSWFVDFEPVRIKMEGRTRSELRQSSSYAALFPDYLEPSPIGPVPGGWSVGPMGQFADLMIGGDWGQDLPGGECTEVACLRGVDIHNLRTSGWSDVPHRYVKRKSADKRRPTDCDVLVEGSGACGRSIAYQPRIEKQLGVSVIYSNFCKRLRAATPAAAALIEFFLNDMVRSGEMLEFVTGTAMPNLDIHGLLRNRQMVMPDDGVLEAFGKVCEGWRSKLLSPESRALASLRDTLLPELLAGDRQTVQSEAATE